MSINDVGTNIRRLMKLKGYTIPQIAKQMEMGTASISNILNGKSEPKSSTLLKFSHALEVGISDLLADPPILNGLRYRTNKRLTAREKAEKDQILHMTHQWLSNTHYLEVQLDDKIDYKFASLKRDSGPYELAQLVRKEFGLAAIQPVFDLPSEIEDAGIKLYLHRFGFKKTFGLSVSDKELGPAIVVNSEKDISIERRIFTIAHELGHLLLHRDSYDNDRDRDEDDRQEHEADQFAGLLLMPDEALMKEWEDAGGLHWINRVLKIKKIYQVSYRTVLTRLNQIYPQYQDINLFQKFAVDYKALYHHDLKNHYEPEPIEKSDSYAYSNEPAPLDDFFLMEDRFAKLVKQAYFQGIISLSKAGEMMGQRTAEMRKLVASWKEMEIHD